MQIKTIGLIGGIGWASTAEYYRLLNEMVVERMGTSHSARIAMLSLNQHDFTSRAAQPGSYVIEEFLVQQGQRLQAAGADFFALCANGAHRFAPRILPRIGMPFVSIVDATARRVQASGIERVGLLGVRQTMAGRFYHDRLEAVDVDVITPDAAEQEIVHNIIYDELVHNRITDASRAVFQRIIASLAQRGAGGVVLGCTEIPLLIKAPDVDVPVFDTTDIHCRAIVAHAFGLPPA